MITVENDEYVLVEKLLKTFHLNVLERKQLPNCKARLSVIKMVIKNNLDKVSYFPNNWRPKKLFDGALLKKISDNKIRLYHKEEISMSRYELLETIDFNTLDKAVIKFLTITYGDNIDGVEIDYCD